MGKLITVIIIFLFGSVTSHNDLDLWEAAKDGQYGEVNKALAAGANLLFGSLTSQNDIDLWEGAKNGNLDKVKKALASGANPNWRNLSEGHGWTALHVASANNHPGIVKTLLEAGASVGIKDTKTGSTALHWAASNNNPAVARVLLNAGADKDICADDGVRPLFSASWKGSTRTVRELLVYGADVNLQNCKGWFGEMTPLMIASSEGNLNTVKLLVKFDANVSLSSPKGHTALHIAAGAGHEEIVKILLIHGADATKVADGMTPSMIARKRGFNKLAEYLDRYAEIQKLSPAKKVVLLAGAVGLLLGAGIYYALA